MWFGLVWLGVMCCIVLSCCVLCCYGLCCSFCVVMVGLLRARVVAVGVLYCIR